MTLRCEVLNVTLNGTPVLRAVDLALADGFNILIGANGSGKTTLLRTLAGLQAPHSGSIWLGEEDLTRHGAAFRSRRGILYRGQRPLLTPGLCASDYLRLAFTSEPVARSIERAVALGFPADLAHRLSAPQPIDRLSLRDRRMLELMTATVPNTRALLLDEPLASLGADAIALVGPLLEALAARQPLLIVEHRREFFAWLADRPLTASFLEDGTIRFSGQSAEAMLADPGVIATYGRIA